jgi:hypothetical protein
MGVTALVAVMVGSKSGVRAKFRQQQLNNSTMLPLGLTLSMKDPALPSPFRQMQP